MENTIKVLSKLQSEYENRASVSEKLGCKDSALDYVLKSITLSQTISILNGEIVKRAKACSSCKWRQAKYEYRCSSCFPAYSKYELDEED